LSVHVFSDGRLAAEDPSNLALPGSEVFYERLGRPDTANVGFVTAAVRRSDDNPERVSVFARLLHSGPEATAANVTMRIGGRAIRTKAVELPAASERGPGDAAVTFEFTRAGEAEIELVHDRPDPLPADDAARLTLLPAQRLSVLLVTDDNPYLRGAINAAGARRLEVIDPARYEQLTPEALSDGGEALSGYDVVVFDRYPPEAVPPISSLSFGSAPPIPGLAVRPATEDAPALQGVLTWQRDHPLMRYVVLDDVTLRRPGRLTVPVGAEVLAVGLAGPLMAEAPGRLMDRGEENRAAAGESRAFGARHVAVSFDLLDSRWPHHWSFQVFMVNALQTLGLDAAADEGGGAAVAYRTGQTATVSVPAGLSSVTYDGPVRVTGTVRQGRASLPAFPEAGWYDATTDGLEPPADRLGVSVLDATESDVRAAETLGVAGGVVSVQGEDASVRREVWMWFAWAALAMLLVEWFVYTRRMRV
jgi:hypothetical protein